MLDVDAHLLETLLASTGRGDSEAFTRMLALVRPLLMGVAMRILQCRASAEEVLQESILKVWQSASTYAPALGSALAWLKVVVRNHALDLLRRHKREARPSHLNDMLEVAPDPFDICCGSRDAQRVRRALSSLPHFEREAVILFYFRGHTHAEIAVLMSIPLGTIKAWLNRSLRKLQRLLQGNGDAPLHAYL